VAHPITGYEKKKDEKKEEGNGLGGGGWAERGKGR